MKKWSEMTGDERDFERMRMAVESRGSKPVATRMPVWMACWGLKECDFYRILDEQFPVRGI